jgi:hypothetical protein
VREFVFGIGPALGIWLLVFGCSFAGLGAPADEGLGAAVKGFVPSTKYATTHVAGWTVRVNRELLTTQSALGSNALQLLSQKLRDITNAVPPRACDALRQVPLWLGVDDGHAPCAEYHPSKQWLGENGYNPDKAKCIEIGNARRFIEWSRTQPSMILHELAHAYHDQVLSFSHARIKAAFARAQAGGAYDSVEHADGRKKRSYALSNEREYFAESTEAFFGTNDFYPFTRDELKRHDPEIFSLLEELWR